MVKFKGCTVSLRSYMKVHFSMKRSVLLPVVFAASEPASRQKNVMSGGGSNITSTKVFLLDCLWTWPLPLLSSSPVPSLNMTGRRNGPIRVLELFRAYSVVQSCP